MADRYWVGGTGNWDATTTHWSTTSGGASGASVPTAADNVYFDANSGGGVVTVNTSNRLCLNLSFRGLSGTSDFTGTFTSSGTGAVTISGSLVLSASTTYTYTASLTFNATTTGFTITSNGVTWSGSITFNGVGGEWRAMDDLVMLGVLTLTNGTFLAYFNLTTTSISTNNSNIRTFQIDGTLYLTGSGALIVATTSTNLVWSSFSIIVTGSQTLARTLTFNTIVYPGNGYCELGGTGSGSITLAVGTTGDPRVWVTNTGGAVVSFSTGNMNELIFTGGTNVVWTNSGAQGLTIDSSLTLTSTMGTPTLTPSFTFRGATSIITLAGKSLVTGTVTLNDTSIGAGTGTFTFADTFSSNAAVTITSAGTVNINANFSLTLVTNILTLTAGNLNVNNGANITCGIFSSNTSNSRILNMGSGTWNITGTGTVWTIGATGMTLNAGQSRILINNTANPTVGATFNGGGLTYYTVEYARGASTATNSISGNNTFANFIDNTSTAAHTYSWVSGTTQTFYKFNVKGSAGAVITMARSASTVVTFVKVGQGIVNNCDYVSANSTTTATPANTWYIGANGVGGGGGWILNNAPSSQSLLGAGGVG